MFGPEPADQAKICPSACLFFFFFGQLWRDSTALGDLEKQILASTPAA